MCVSFFFYSFVFFFFCLICWGKLRAMSMFLFVKSAVHTSVPERAPALCLYVFHRSMVRLYAVSLSCVHACISSVHAAFVACI